MIDILDETNDLKSSAQARGKRLKTARMMTGLTRKALENKYQISASTIQAWETAKAGGLTERGAVRVVPMLRQEGILCSTEWLLYGIGAGLQCIQRGDAPHPLKQSNAIKNDSKTIIQEILAFRNLHPGAIDLVVLDNGMEPQYKAGDYVAGIQRTGEKIEDALNKDCIVQTAENNIVFRRVKKGSKHHFYNLVCVNPDTTVFLTTLYDQELLNAAPVIWHRRKSEKE